MAVPLMVASTVISAAGAMSTASAQSDAAAYNSQVAQQNAVAAQQQGVAAVDQQQRDAAQRMGAMIAGYGASGVKTDSGSPVDVLADSARQAAMGKANTQYNYQLKALGYTNQANLDNSAAQNYLTSGMFNATSAVLRGGAQTAGYSYGGSPIPRGY